MNGKLRITDWIEEIELINFRDVRNGVLPISERSGEMGSQRVVWQKK